jgi:hypothetical protein
MPNPLERRRVGESAEVAQLKKELEELKASYARDVSLISADIREIASRVDTPANSGDTASA